MDRIKHNAKTLIVSILLLFSLAINAVLYQLTRAYYTELNQVRLYPLGLGVFAENEAIDAPTFVFYGDSRAADWPPPDIAGWHFINRGIGRQTTAQILGRIHTHLTPLAYKKLNEALMTLLSEYSVFSIPTTEYRIPNTEY